MAPGMPSELQNGRCMESVVEEGERERKSMEGEEGSGGGRRRFVMGKRRLDVATEKWQVLRMLEEEMGMDLYHNNHNSSSSSSSRDRGPQPVLFRRLVDDMVCMDLWVALGLMCGACQG